MKIKGVCHPIPQDIAEIIYEGKRTFVVKSLLKKTKKNHKFLLYESRGSKAYTGWGDIDIVEHMHPLEIWNKYQKQLVLDKNNYFKYVSKKSVVTVIKLKNFELFPEKIIPKTFVSMRGKYLYEEEYMEITKKLDEFKKI